MADFAVRTIARVSLLLVVLVCGLPGVATGQERSGFWVGLDVGLGSAGTSAGGTVGSVFDDDRGWTGASTLGLGWAVNPQLLVGIELGRGTSWTWWVGDMKGTLDTTSVSGILTYYPRAARGFYIKGGLGGSFSQHGCRGLWGTSR
jgi:hypothetical protein